MDRVLDKFESLANDAQLALCILGNTETSDFELIDVDDCPLPTERRREQEKRGMVFLGVVGLVDGIPRTALAEPLDFVVVDVLARAFLSHIGSKLHAEARRTNDAAVRWLADLYSFNDPRHDA